MTQDLIGEVVRLNNLWRKKFPEGPSNAFQFSTDGIKVLISYHHFELFKEFVEDADSLPLEVIKVRVKKALHGIYRPEDLEDV